jgi:hypothetical protein
VAVEKLAPEKCGEKRSRQEAPQTIFSGRLDIFYPPPISAYFEKKRLFQQPQMFLGARSNEVFITFVIQSKV